MTAPSYQRRVRASRPPLRSLARALTVIVVLAACTVGAAAMFTAAPARADNPAPPPTSTTSSTPAPPPQTTTATTPAPRGAPGKKPPQGFVDCSKPQTGDNKLVCDEDAKDRNDGTPGDAQPLWPFVAAVPGDWTNCSISGMSINFPQCNGAHGPTWPFVYTASPPPTDGTVCNKACLEEGHTSNDSGSGGEGLTQAFLRYLVSVPDLTKNVPDLSTFESDTAAIAFGLLAVVMTIAVIRYWVAGLSGSGRGGGELAEGLLRSLFVAVAIIAWPTLWKNGIALTNTVSKAMLDLPVVSSKIPQLWLSAALGGASVGLLTLITGGITALIVALIVVVMLIGLFLFKITLTATAVVVFAGMPLALLLHAVGDPIGTAGMAARAFVATCVIPIVWALLACLFIITGVGVNNWFGGSTGFFPDLIPQLTGLALLLAFFTVPRAMLRRVTGHGGGGGFAGRAMSYAAGRALLSAGGAAISHFSSRAATHSVGPSGQAQNPVRAHAERLDRAQLAGGPPALAAGGSGPGPAGGDGGGPAGGGGPAPNAWVTDGSGVTTPPTGADRDAASGGRRNAAGAASAAGAAGARAQPGGERGHGNGRGARHDRRRPDEERGSSARGAVPDGERAAPRAGQGQGPARPTRRFGSAAGESGRPDPGRWPHRVDRSAVQASWDRVHKIGRPTDALVRNAWGRLSPERQSEVRNFHQAFGGQLRSQLVTAATEPGLDNYGAAAYHVLGAATPSQREAVLSETRSQPRPAGEPGVAT